MQTILFDDIHSEHLLPLTFTRSTADFRIGILTIKEKWEQRLKSEILVSPFRSYLLDKYKAISAGISLYINARALPNADLIGFLESLKDGDIAFHGDKLLAYVSNEPFHNSESINLETKNVIHTELPSLVWIDRPYHIFQHNGTELVADFELITKGRKSATLSSTNTLINAENIFAEEGVSCECAVLNAKDGPIYLGKNSEVMEGSLVRGGFALCESAGLKLGAKIYGPTTVGPHSKVGGEVNNSVIFGFSNKGHDGFLGNSVLGEWCNLGADTNNSNLKNNYAEVRLWDYVSSSFTHTGMQFCGLIMGDHSKCGINTMFNTGTVVGVGANIFGAGYPKNFIPSFAWGGSAGTTTYKLDKIFETAEIVMSRRKIELTESDKNMFDIIYNETKENR